MTSTHLAVSGAAIMRRSLFLKQLQIRLKKTDQITGDGCLRKLGPAG